jgi:hypothetical protein
MKPIGECLLLPRAEDVIRRAEVIGLELAQQIAAAPHVPTFRPPPPPAPVSKPQRHRKHDWKDLT